MRTRTVKDSLIRKLPESTATHRNGAGRAIDEVVVPPRSETDTHKWPTLSTVDTCQVIVNWRSRKSNCKYLDDFRGDIPMRRVPFFVLVLGLAAVAANSYGDEFGGLPDSPWLQPPASIGLADVDAALRAPKTSLTNEPMGNRLEAYIVRGQDDGGGAGAGQAVDPSVPLAQLQIQNEFVLSTYNASGYSNRLVLQPVVPIHINSELFPYHIVRPTLPVIAPTPDLDGPLGVEGGLGDLLLLDVYAHPIPDLKLNLGVGYAAILPTATDPQLGLREWQLGPAAFAVSTAIPKWVIGGIYQQPFSLESNAYVLQTQLIATRLLPDNWYLGWGDRLWTLDTQNGDYDMAICARVGKVVSLGTHPVNIFIQPSYTPKGMHSGSNDEWNIKLSVSLLFPKAKFGPICGNDRVCR